MNRRTLITLAVAATSLPVFAFAGETLDYSDGLIKKRLAAGETLLVDWAADWCSTCARQERVISQLRAENPIYDENITFIRIDWDTHAGAEVTTSRNIPRRSTLVLMKGNDELGRLVAVTSTEAIAELLDKGVDGGS